MTTAKNPSKTQEIFEIPLGQIEISPDNVRESRPETDLDELAASIRIHGLLQPVVLKGRFGNPPYELIGGQRRYLAHQQLRKSTIKATYGHIVTHGGVSSMLCKMMPTPKVPTVGCFVREELRANALASRMALSHSSGS